MTAMENKAYGKVEVAALGWMTSFPTSLGVDSLASWVVKGVAHATVGGGEERTWSIHSSTCCKM